MWRPKFSQKQQKELKLIEWFIPKKHDWKHPHIILHDDEIGITGVKEDKNGVTAEEAFFMRSERGKFPKSVKNKARLRVLLYGKMWRERHYSEIWDRKYPPLLSDFDDTPDYVREFFKKWMINSKEIKHKPKT